MKVCMIVASDAYNDSRIDREARALSDAGHRVTVLARQRVGLPLREWRRGYEIIRVCPTRLRRHRFDLHPAILAAAIRYHADVYHAHDLRTTPIALIAARLTKAHLIYDAHELYLEKDFLARAPTLLRRMAMRFERWIIAQASATIAVNDAIADVLVRRYGCPRPTVVRNCVECPPATFRPVDLHAELSIDARERIVLYQGHLGAGRGIENLVQAMQWLHGHTLVLFGDGPLRARLAREAARVGCGDRVLIAGAVPMDSLLRYTAGADVGVVPFLHTCLNNYLALPNKLFEYLAAGLPVAVSDFPEMRKIVRNEGVGATFDPTAPRSIANAILSITNDPVHYRQLCTNVRRAVSERYNWQNESRTLTSLYERLSEGVSAIR